MTNKVKIRSRVPCFSKSLISDLQSNNCVFLLGAGISMLLPSGLPSGADFKNLLVKSLFAQNALIPYVDILVNLKEFHQIVPEILFQKIHESLRDKLLPFFDILQCANPNISHKTIAFFSDYFNTPIFTTNFDTLIDNAAKRTDNIFHIHGSLDDTSQLIMRINQVGRGLDTSNRSLLAQAVKGRRLYVFGYSGNDKDIIDALNNCEPDKIYWIVKDYTDNYTLANIDRLACKCECNIVSIDLNKLFLYLSGHFQIKLDPPSTNDNAERNNILNNWHQSITMQERLACMEKLFNILGQHDLSAEICIYAIKKNHIEGIHSKSWFYNEAAAEMIIAGNFRKGLYYSKKAIEHQTSPPNHCILSLSFNILGWLYTECKRPNYGKAIHYLKNAIKQIDMFALTPEAIPLSEGINIIYGMIFNNLGLAYHGLNKHHFALDCYKKSIKFKRKAGDLIGISNTSANLCITLYKAKEFNKYYYWKKKADALIEKYSLLRQKAFMLREVGKICCSQGRITEGLRMLGESLVLYTGLNNSDYDTELVNKAIVLYAGKI